MPTGEKTWEEWQKEKRKGDVIKTQLKDKMYVTVSEPVIGYYDSPRKRVVMHPGDVGVIINKAAPKATYKPKSANPNERRTTFCLVSFYCENTKRLERCSPDYDKIVIIKGEQLRKLEYEEACTNYAGIFGEERA